MPAIAEFIIAVLTLLLGAGLAAILGLRKLRPELAKLQAESEKLKAESGRLQAESEKLKADSELARAQRDSAQADAMESISGAVKSLLEPLNQEIGLLRAGREEDRKRIRNLEKSSAEIGKENVNLRCAVENLQSQNVTLTEEIASLRRIIDDYRSGRRKPTGPLALERETP